MDTFDQSLLGWLPITTARRQLGCTFHNYFRVMFHGCLSLFIQPLESTEAGSHPLSNSRCSVMRCPSAMGIEHSLVRIDPSPYPRRNTFATHCSTLFRSLGLVEAMEALAMDPV